MNENYVRGFMSKCAEYGVPEDAAVALLKAAQMYRSPAPTPLNPDSYAKTAPDVTTLPGPADQRGPGVLGTSGRPRRNPDVRTLPYKPGTAYQRGPGIGTSPIEAIFKKNPKLKNYLDGISKNVNAITNMQNVVTR